MSANFQVGDWLVEPSRNRIVRQDIVKEIEPRHMRLLVYLSQHPGKQITSARLLQEAYRSKRASEDSLTIAINHLREALEDKEGQTRYIKPVPGKGYSLLAKVRWIKADGEPPRRGLHWKIIVGALLVALVVFLLQRRKADEEIQQLEEPLRIIAMLPTRNLEEAGNHQGLTQAVEVVLHQRLARIPNMEVVRLPEPAADGTVKLPEDVTVDAVLESWISVSGEKVTIRAQVARVHPRRLLWAHSVAGSLADIQSLHKELGRQMALFLGRAPVPAGEGGNIPPEAYEAFIRGHALLQASEYKRAIDQFEDARTLSPDFAEPYLGLALARTKLAQADPLLLRKELEHLTNLLNRAIELKPDLAEAYTALGALQFLYTWQFGEAEFHLRRALELNPNDAEAHHWFGMFCLAFGRFEEARRALGHVRRLNPFNYSRIDAAWMFNLMSDHDSAATELKSLPPAMTQAAATHSAWVRLLENMDREDEAYGHYHALFVARGYGPDEMAEAERQYATGKLAGLSRWLAFEKFEQHDVGQYEPPLSIARYLATAGDKKLAFDWLEKALAVKQTQLLWLNVDPKYDRLRSDPRFSALISRIGLDYNGSSN